MNQYKRDVERDIPGYLEDLVSKDKILQIFTLIDQKHSWDEIVSSGILAESVTTTFLRILLEEKIIEPLPGAQQSNPILLLTDSAADLPKEIIKERGIGVVPLTVNIDGKEYLDGVDLSSDNFYNLVDRSKSFPVTSPPSRETFHNFFLQNIAERDVLGIFISKGMSKTMDIANKVVRANLNSYIKKRRSNPNLKTQVRIELLDSGQVSMGTALLVLEASDKIKEGWPLQKIKEHIKTLTNEIRVYFMVDNLDYLAQGGRIGRGRAMLGNFFGFKPILGMNGGGVDAKSKVFGRNRAQRKIVDYIKEDIRDPKRNLRIGICHAQAPDKADKIQNLVEQSFPNQNNIISSFGPTVGSHVGPGAIGIAWLVSPDD